MHLRPKFITPQLSVELWKTAKQENPELIFQIGKSIMCSNILLIADELHGTIPGYFIRAIEMVRSPTIKMEPGDTAYIDMYERTLFDVTNFYDTGIISTAGKVGPGIEQNENSLIS